MFNPARALFALSILISGTALADTVTVTFNGVTTGTPLTVYRPSGGAISTSAGTMSISLGGDDYDAYCVDLNHTIYTGLTYTAELVAMEAEEPWCSIAWIVSYADSSDATSAAEVQVALWKLLEPGLTVSNAAVDAGADALVAEASGACPLSCASEASFEVTTTDRSDGTVDVEIQLSQDGAAVVGQEISLSISGGALLDPADGLGVTDEDGIVFASVDPGAGGAFTLDLSADGRTLYRVEPVGSYQQLLAFTYDTCSTEDEASWAATALGDPHTIGFWKQQTAIAMGESRAKAKVSAATLESWLSLDIFGTSFDSVSQLNTALWLSKATMRQRAIQQCLASRLNLEWGATGWFSDVDLDGDGGSDGLFWEIWGQAEYAFDSGDYETAKTICDTFNNL